MREYLKTHEAKGANADSIFHQGDIITTTVRCANGETIVMSLDTTLPRYYSRDFTVRGTKGFYEERTNSVFLDGDEHSNWREHWNNFEKFRDEYEHPIWQRFLKEGVLGGHGGMDGLVYGAFIDCLQKGCDMPIDVYDAASWMAITPLSEASILLGGAPQIIPDFTNGRWLAREKGARSDYALD